MQVLSDLDNQQIGIYDFQNLDLNSMLKDQFKAENLGMIVENHLNSFNENNDFVDVVFSSQTSQLKQLCQTKDKISFLQENQMQIKLIGLQNTVPELKSYFNQYFKKTMNPITCDLHLCYSQQPIEEQFKVESVDQYIFQLMGGSTLSLPTNEDESLKTSIYENGITEWQEFDKVKKLNIDPQKSIKVSRGIIYQLGNNPENIKLVCKKHFFSNIDVLCLYAKNMIKFEKEYLKKLMNDSEINEEKLALIRDKILLKIEEVGMTTSINELKNKITLRNSLFAKTGEPCSEKMRKMYASIVGIA